MMNNVSIVGTVGKLFYRETLKGGFVLNMSVVTNDYMGRSKGVVANWHQVVYFGDKAAELIEKYKLSTGDRVSVNGKIVYEEVGNSDDPNTKHKKIAKIYADKVTPIFCMRTRKNERENYQNETTGNASEAYTEKRRLNKPADFFDRGFNVNSEDADYPDDDSFGNR